VQEEDKQLVFFRRRYKVRRRAEYEQRVYTPDTYQVRRRTTESVEEKTRYVSRECSPARATPSGQSIRHFGRTRAKLCRRRFRERSLRTLLARGTVADKIVSRRPFITKNKK